MQLFDLKHRSYHNIGIFTPIPVHTVRMQKKSDNLHGQTCSQKLISDMWFDKEEV